MIICPNLHLPDVAREFNEIKAATSEKAAYHIWSANNGNGIDKAPNGAQSKLFNDLLRLTNGNREEAIRLKAKVYGNSFKEWFGDWQNDPENASKVVDENGEPLIVYHGGQKGINVFLNRDENPNYEKLAEDFFYPVTKYVKIQGIDEKFPLMLNVYEVILTTKLDDVPFEGLIHTSKNIDNVLPSEYNSRVKGKKITQSQYDFACTKQIGLIGG